MPFMRSSEPERTRAPSEGACYLYVLPCAYEDLLKLGFSRQPLDRMQALQPRWFEFFDLDRALLVETETVRDARGLELELRRRLREHGAPAPLTIRIEAAGHTEWYRGAYPALSAEVERLSAIGHTVHVPMRPWLQGQLRTRADLLFAWTSRVIDGVQGEPALLDLPSMAPLRRQVLDTLDAYAALGIDVEDHLPDAIRCWYHARLH